MQPLFRTRLTELFGIPHPILIGGMMWLSRADFVAAAARAGVLAFMTPRSYESPSAFREGLARAVDLADGHPVGVNFSISRFRGRNELNDDFLKIAQAAGVTRFETAGSHPGDLIQAIHDRGGVLIHKSTQVRHAIAAQNAGVDAITIVGMEAGGHPGVNPHPSHVLLADALKHIHVPIVLGGALGTGQQILGALAQGAEGALLATRFLAAAEIEAHQNYKARIAAAGMDDSVTALATLRDTWRVLDNATLREVRRIEDAGGATHADFGKLIHGQYTRDNAYQRGDVERGMLSCSSAVGHANRTEPTTEIIKALLSEMTQALARLHALEAHSQLIE